MSMITISSLLGTKLKDVPAWGSKNLTRANLELTGRTIYENYNKTYDHPWPAVHFMAGFGTFMYCLNWRKEYQHYQHERHEKIYGKGHH